MTKEFRELMRSKWAEALKASGTPENFTEKTSIIIFENDRGVDVPYSWIYAPGYADRRRLMEAQKEETEKRKSFGAVPRWTNDGNTSCFLCDNVGQAKDVGNNLILPWGNFRNYVLLPNKYPAYVGDMLLIPKEHNKGNQHEQPFPGDYLPTGVEIAERYKLDFVRNHPKAGMSIPMHDHLQIKSTQIDTNRGKTTMTQIVREGLSPTNYGEGIFSVNRTRFDTIALKGKKSLEKMVGLTNKLIADRQIFTFYYHPDGEKRGNGVFYVSAYKASDEKKRVGAGTPLCVEVVGIREHPSYEELMQVPMQFLHARGMFNWEKYL